MITVKTDAEIALMRESGRLTKNVLDLIGSKIRVGMTTKDLDAIMDRLTKKREHKNTPGAPGNLSLHEGTCGNLCRKRKGNPVYP